MRSGSHPLFQVFKLSETDSREAVFFGAFTRLAGFTWASLRREQRPVSKEFVEFLRDEQMGRVRRLLSGRPQVVENRANRANLSDPTAVRNTNVKLSR